MNIYIHFLRIFVSSLFFLLPTPALSGQEPAAPRSAATTAVAAEPQAAGHVKSTRGDRLSLKYQSPAVERATPICLVWPEFRRLDSMKTPTLFAGMGSANKYPWADPQPANANSWCWLIVSTPSAITLRSRLRASPTMVVTMA